MAYSSWSNTGLVIARLKRRNQSSEGRKQLQSSGDDEVRATGAGPLNCAHLSAMRQRQAWNSVA